MSDFKKKLPSVLGAAAIAAVVIVLFLSGALFSIDAELRDLLYKDPQQKNPHIFVVGIDQRALAELGPFQYWGVQKITDALNILNADPDYKPAVIGINVTFPRSGEPDADAAFAQAVANGGNVVVGATKYELPFPELAAVCDYGYKDFTPDRDSVVRFSKAEDSFAAAVLRKYSGDVNIPTRSDGSFYIAYSCDLHAYYGYEGMGFSFVDIFSEDFDPEQFADEIVLIGPYASGLMDAYFTPMNQQAPMHGVEIHANIIQMALDGNFKTVIPKYLELLILFVLAVLFIALLNVADIRLSFAVVVLFCGAYVFANRFLYDNGYIFNTYLLEHGYVLFLLYSIVLTAGLFIYQVAFNFVTERIEKQRIKSSFKKYVDPKLVDKLIETGEADSDAVGAKRDIAVLFVDVRGFTPMSERLKDEPETIVKILNNYLELTSSSVFNNGGSVDKFIGDATMALFNGFVPMEDYVFRGVKAAWDIVQGAQEVNRSILEKYGVNVGFGIGVHCGPAIVGNCGPSFRKDYTAIGDTVTISEKLESVAKASQVLVSKAVVDICGDRITVESVGEVQKPGEEPLEGFAVTGIKG